MPAKQEIVITSEAGQFYLLHIGALVVMILINLGLLSAFASLNSGLVYNPLTSLR